MKVVPRAISLWTLFVVSLALARIATAADDPLPSWNDTTPKKAIFAFVERVTREGSPDFVPESRS